ncbi:MAG: hypothetical protein F6K40_00665 [Okeania sp. SIO3I5]|uniref:hypothetical protein n=1 Tax=Okeania sp. SIO3I5 TaxID=2607805 RepID=UPI0013BB5B69|nr:hypothetical protein [Okeania sp. SIO3I5]NEQ34899.1 hypothetical protein [Okeania sp. SIO3I5]
MKENIKFLVENAFLCVIRYRNKFSQFFMLKFLQDAAIKLLQGVVEQLPTTQKNDEEKLEEKDSSNYLQTDIDEEIYNSLDTLLETLEVSETKQIVENTKRSSIMPNKKIYNRKVYMLIDQSGSMVRRDPLFNNERRWKAIAEAIEGHVYNILNEEGMNGEKICDEITVTFFSPNRPPTIIRPIQDDSQVPTLFEENQPDSNTFLAPTFEKIVGQWFGTRMQNEGGFIIIYTDGELDDRETFVNYVKETCGKLNSQDELKVVIIGFGSDVNRDSSFYLKLDANANTFTDKNSKPCNIVVFDLLNKMPGIIDLLNRQLEDAKAGLPVWGKAVCPELYD